MNIKLLDCTLRDGGYCNSWRFGYENIKRIIKSLSDSNVDIVECGFLTNRIQYNQDISKYSTIQDVAAVLNEIGLKIQNRKHVVMTNFGEYDFNELPDKSSDIPIDGIRLAFHKKDRLEALEQARIIKKKGYIVFLQPMVTLSYTDSEFLDLIKESNKLQPYAFYIVDSFGTMKRRELTRLFFLVDHNLEYNIAIGFHSHNNMQLAYSNAQGLLDLHTKHDLIIDSSIYGMGRGAGNLNTELFINYLNENFDKHYDVKPLLRVIDRVLDAFYKENHWGYSLPNYLSAAYDTHPNYAGFLSEKNSLNVEDMDSIISMMDDEKRVRFDKLYAEEIYNKYLSNSAVYTERNEELKRTLNNAKVVLIAPGKSSHDKKNDIIAFIKKNDVHIISINHSYDYITPEFIFVSNLRRFRELEKQYIPKCIVTSNISSSDVYTQTDYSELLGRNEYVSDNAGLMAIRFLINCGVNEIILVGFDGYSYNASENYSKKELLLITSQKIIDAMNEGMKEELMKLKEKVSLKYLTIPRYLNSK